jgi:hypothetical protein
MVEDDPSKAAGEGPAQPPHEGGGPDAAGAAKVLDSGGASEARAYVAPVDLPKKRAIQRTVDMSKVRIAPDAAVDPRRLPTIRKIVMTPPAPGSPWAATPPAEAPISAPAPGPAPRPLLGIAIVGVLALAIAALGLVAARGKGWIGSDGARAGATASAAAPASALAIAAPSASSSSALAAPTAAPAADAAPVAASASAAQTASTAPPPARPVRARKPAGAPELVE